MLRRPSLCDLSSQKLSSLRLEYFAAVDDFAKAMAPSPSLFDNLQELFLYVNVSLPPVLPPNLLSLKLRNYNFTTDVIDLERYIPKSVTGLKLPIWIDGFVGEFSPALQELTMLIISFEATKLPALPTSLIKLTIHECYPLVMSSNYIGCPDVSHLKSLTKLCVVQQESWPQERYLTLPPGLKHFEFSSNRADELVKAPPILPASLPYIYNHRNALLKEI